MKTSLPSSSPRPARHLNLDCDFAVTGGGVAGVCAALTAARGGLKTVLMQDRPVLGGNASSEVRLWVLGATAHLFNNNRWAREGGIIDEILLCNWQRNPEGNPLIFDSVLLEKVLEEPNITLLLNTAVHDLEKDGPDRIQTLEAFCSQNSTRYTVSAPLFCDASGDGIVGFLSGAAFRMGAESADEFGEKFAPDESYGKLLGHSMYFYSKDAGHPIQYTPPSFSLKDVEKEIPHFRRLNTTDDGCRLWWLEYGGRLDTVHDSEHIKLELWKVVYGVWDYIKNSGKFPDAENLTLEWVSTIPGKRESRRFEGDKWLTQSDLVQHLRHDDAVSFGGWAIDLHPADGVYCGKASCTQWHSKGTYTMPYRCLYSRNIENLFLAGRITSVSHVAFGSTRVIGTCSHAAQAVGKAAVICHEKKLSPRQTGQQQIDLLQQELLKDGQHIPGLSYQGENDLIRNAELVPSSEWQLESLPADGPWQTLEQSRGQWLPFRKGAQPDITLQVRAKQATKLRLELRPGHLPDGYTPGVAILAQAFEVSKGEQEVTLSGIPALEENRYLLLAAEKNPEVEIRTSLQKASGLVSCYHRWSQQPEEDIGVENFEFWVPERRPDQFNFAFKSSTPLHGFESGHLQNGFMRPTDQPNAWLCSPEDSHPSLIVKWKEPQTLHQLDLFFDGDFDHAAESALWGHPDRGSQFRSTAFTVKSDQGTTVYEKTNGHLSLSRIRFESPLRTTELKIEFAESPPHCPAGLMGIYAY